MHPCTSNLELKVLSGISSVIDKALNLEDALEEVLGILHKTLSMERATVTLVDRETGQLAIVASCGLTPDEKNRGVYRLDEGVTGKIFQTGRPFYIPDIRKEPLFLDKTGARGLEKGTVSFIGVPIILHGDPIGVLNVDRLFGDDIRFDIDVEFLSVVATLVAQLISINEQVRRREEILRRENASLKYRISKESHGLYIVGKSPAMMDVQRQIEKVAPTRATVLLLGESGTGKTLIARIIHDLSERRAYPFIKINCASIPENLLEAELFGHEKGSFTGASMARAGRFEDAHEGTIFLDEIGELPLGLQAKLLRVLQDKEFERIGSNKTIKVNVRILAATNRHLGDLVEEGMFRADLYYRLNVFPINTPPLRDRPEDVESLLNHFLSKVSRRYGRELNFTTQALNLLKSHGWPGNVREMENLVERLVILAEGDRIEPTLIHSCLSSNGDASPVPPRRDESRIMAEYGYSPSLKDMEKSEIIAALRRNQWIQLRAAKDLGITPRQMGYRVIKFGLETMIAAERAKLRTERRERRQISVSSNRPPPQPPEQGSGSARR